MPLSGEERAKLDDYRFMMGTDAGTLALVLEQLTDAMALVGLHKVYCRVEKGPRAGAPPHDILDLLERLEAAKGLVQETLGRLREDRRP